MKKEEILTAAGKCFYEYGYSKTSMSDIGRAVGLNKASLYYHFKDKFTIYREVVMKNRKLHLYNIKEVIASCETDRERILTFLKEEIKFSRQGSKMLVTNNVDISGTKSETKVVYYELLNDNVQIISGYIESGIRTKEFHECNALHIAEIIIKVVDGLMHNECPLNAPLEEMNQAYESLANTITDTMGLILNGIMMK